MTGALAGVVVASVSIASDFVPLRGALILTLVLGLVFGAAISRPFRVVFIPGSSLLFADVRAGFAWWLSSPGAIR